MQATYVSWPFSLLDFRRSSSSGSGGGLVSPRTVKHEFGHAFGYWHTGNVADLMSGFGDARCNQDPSERERIHAAIMYGRPNGNVNPDTDPSGVNLLSVRDAPIVRE